MSYRSMHHSSVARFRLAGSPALWVVVMMVLGAGLVPGAGYAQTQSITRLKDLVVLEGAAPLQLTGYGLVVGLNRTGDRARGRRSAPYTVQSVANMLRQFGIAVDPAYLSSRNVAAVMVTADMNPFTGPGGRLDVTVSAMGDARSLSGGVLLQTPLLDPLTKQVYAQAQGPLATGGASASGGGASVRVNATNTGRIPNGAVVRTMFAPAVGTDEVTLVLRRPDFTNAVRIAETVNEAYGNVATAEHAGQVRVRVPAGINGAAALMAQLEDMTIAVDVPARVVVNERTGTIVAGGEVGISQVMVTYGSLIVSTEETPVVSQPNPLANGETVTGVEGRAAIDQETTRSVVLPTNTNVNELAAALNELGLTARDVIAIFQAIDRAGALQGELVIL